MLPYIFHAIGNAIFYYSLINYLCLPPNDTTQERQFHMYLAFIVFSIPY